MNEYWIDFEGYCLVKANSEEEAKQKFFTEGPNCSIQEPTFEIYGIEEKKG